MVNLHKLSKMYNHLVKGYIPRYGGRKPIDGKMGYIRTIRLK